MFSIFYGGITNIVPNATFDLTSIARLVKNNPEKDEILEIRDLRIKKILGSNGNMLYKKKKKKISYLTTNAILKKRALSKPGEFESNFLFPSGYIFFDIDVADITQVPEFKQEFIEKYRNQVAFVCYSASMGGISVFVKYSGATFTSVREFDNIRNYIIDNHFTDLKKFIDPNTDGIGQAWFISYDEDPFENYQSAIELPENLFEKENQTKSEEKGNEILVLECKSQYNRLRGGYITLDFSNLPHINEVLQKIKWNTEVVVENKIVDIKEIDFVKIHIPKLIRDGYKRKVFTYVFSNFIFLNNHLPLEYAVSFLMFINYNNTGDDPMPHDSFKRFIIGLLKTYSSGKLYPKSKKKYVHFNKNIPLTKDEKIDIANKLNGIIISNKSIKAINKAKEALKNNYNKVTKAEVIRLTGLSRPTVFKYWDCDPNNIDYILGEINSKEYGN